MTIAIRNSSSTKKNTSINKTPAQAGENNVDWLKRVRAGKRGQGALILLGGTSVSDFRVRCAQAQLRRDLMPSFWSLVGMMMDDGNFVSVPLNLRDRNSDVPSNNGVQHCLLADFADPERYPNMAVIDFTDSFESVRENVELIKAQRSVVDIPSLMLPWLGYIWGAGQSSNPLLGGVGLPSAVFTETVYGLAGIELTPGLSSSSSCPEAIWVSANWWHDFYEAATKVENQQEDGSESSGDQSEEAATENTQASSFSGATATIPRGDFTLRQREAAIKG